MKEILPFLLGIVIVGYQLYMKNREKSENSRKTVGSEAEPPDDNAQENITLETFIDDFFGNRKNEVFADAPSPQKHPFEYETVEDNYEETEKIEDSLPPIDIWDDNKNPLEESIEYSDVEKNIFHSKDIAETDKKGIDNQDYIEDFDLEKAIVYEAILNRPYY